MVQNSLIVVRQVFRLKHLITLSTLEKMNKVMIVTGQWWGTLTQWSSLWRGTAEASSRRSSS